MCEEAPPVLDPPSKLLPYFPEELPYVLAKDADVAVLLALDLIPF